jgi:TolB protein
LGPAVHLQPGELAARCAHKISDAVYERLTGEKGYFDTRVVFVAESGSRTNRSSAWRSWTRTAPTQLPDQRRRQHLMTPRFSSTSQEITYMELRPEGSSIYLLNLDTARARNLGDFKGMVFAPALSRRTAARWPSPSSAAATATSS